MIIALNWRLCFVAKGTHILLLPCTDMPCTTANSLDEPVVFSLLASAIAHEGDSMVQLLCLPHAARLLVNTCTTLACLNMNKAVDTSQLWVLWCVQNQVATHLKCVFGKAGSFLTALGLPKRVKGGGLSSPSTMAYGHSSGLPPQEACDCSKA